jgi:small subunit ribosomal protein S7
MSRRSQAPVRTILPDPKFGSDLLAKFMNMVMERGKKSTAEKIVYGAIERIAERTNRPADQAVALLQQALDNVKPAVEVKSRRVGGATYQVPVEVKAERRLSLAIRWLLASARSRGGKPMIERLALELVDAFNNTGTTIKKREDVQRMAEANRAFSHYGRF